MGLIKWKDINEMLSIKDEIERLLDNMFQNTTFHSWEERYALVSSGMTTPQLNVSQKGEDTVVQVNLPGFEKGDIKVSVSGNLLAIGSELNREREFRGADAYRYQRSHGSFCNVMELPAGVDVSRIKATFKDNILEVVLPKIGSSISDRVQVQIDKDIPLSQNNLPDKREGI